MGRRTPRVTARSIIEAGLLANTPYDEILKQVHEQLPDSAADLTHIKFYRSKLKQENRLTEQTNEAGEQVIAPRSDVPYMGLIGHVEVGGVQFQLFGSMLLTDEYVQREYRTIILKVYRALTDDQRLTVNVARALRIVRRAVNVEWYRYQERPVPERLLQRLEEDMAKAKAAPAEEQEETQDAIETEKQPRVTVKSIITQGLLAGTPDEEIMAEVKSHFPDGKADQSHISYYRSRLYKSGELQRPEKPAKAEKAEETEVEAAPAKAAKAAPAKAAPAKAAPAKAAPAAAKRAPARR